MIVPTPKVQVGKRKSPEAVTRATTHQIKSSGMGKYRRLLPKRERELEDHAEEMALRKEAKKLVLR